MFKYIKILYQDDDLLVISKPPGIVVNRAQTVKSTTLQDWVEEKFPQPFKTFTNDEFLSRSGMVHRLDRDTSGVMLWSLSPKIMYALMSQFKQRTIAKEYRALTHGRLKSESGTITVPLGRLPHDRKKYGVVVGGKLSETSYTVERLFASNKQYPGGFSLVRLFPKTGRTHQLRVVLKHLDHPIVGDRVYGGRKRSRHDSRWCARQFLHAASIHFLHPSTDEPMLIEAPLSSDLIDVLQKLEPYEI